MTGLPEPRLNPDVKRVDPGGWVHGDSDLRQQTRRTFCGKSRSVCEDRQCYGKIQWPEQSKGQCDPVVCGWLPGDSPEGELVFPVSPSVGRTEHNSRVSTFAKT